MLISTVDLERVENIARDTDTTAGGGQTHPSEAKGLGACFQRGRYAIISAAFSTNGYRKEQTMIATIPAQMVKRRGMSALNEQLKDGPVWVIANNVPKCVVFIGSHDEVYG